MRFTLSIAIAICALALGSCSGGPRTLDAAPQDNLAPADVAPTGLPGLPTAAPPTKLTQATPYQFQATDLYAAGGGTMTGPDISLSAPGTTYAIVGAQMTGSDIPKLLHLTGTISSEMWVGVSDWDYGYWDWTSRETGPGAVPILRGDTVNDEGWFYAVLVCPDGHSADVQLSVESEEETWNVMVWIAGDNNLASDAVDDINEMESLGSTDNMNILIGYDIDPAYAPPTTGIDQVHFIKVVEDHSAGLINVTGDPANQSFPRTGYNSADPANLDTFLTWCETNFTANHSMLILWNHGDGWLHTGGSGSGKAPSAARRVVSGVLGDDTDGANDLTNNADVVAAIGSRHFDYLCFDACNMGQIEALYEYRNVADYILASPMLEPGGGYPYDLWLDGWQEFYPVPLESIGMMLCARYCNYWDAEGDDGSMGMYETASLETAISALSDLAAGVTPEGTAEGDHVKQAILTAYKPEMGDGTADLHEFLAEYFDVTSNPTLGSLASSAEEIIEGMTIEHNKTINAGGSSCGVFLPNTGELATYADSYRTTAFNQATSWLEMLEATGVPGGGSEWPTEDWQPGWKVVFEWDDPSPDIQLFIEDPAGDFGYPGDGGDLSDSITFSPDNLVSGVAEEWAELKADPRMGMYLVAINYDAFGPAGPATVNVHTYLEDDTGALQYDFGTTPIERGYSDVWVGLLRYIGEPDGTWVPGDYVEITWATANADMDLEITDPEDVWGCPSMPEALMGRISFSDDSYSSDQPVEWGELLAGGVHGVYLIQVNYYDFSGSPPESMPVQIKLYDSDDLLKQDLGTHIFDGEFGIGGYSDPILLEY